MSGDQKDTEERGCQDADVVETLPAPACPGQTVADAWRDAAARLEAAGIETGDAQLEAEVLLRLVLEVERAVLLRSWQSDLPVAVGAEYEALVQRREHREPLAYIMGHREFYALDMHVDCRVLSPRPETEGLVERALAWAKERRQAVLTIADVGTGSGCLAVALAVHLPAATIYALDVSEDALLVARANAARHGVADRVVCLRGNLLAPLPARVDIIVSNPPYIASAEIAGLQPEVALYEPRMALDGGSDGLDAIRRLLHEAPGRLNPAGAVFLEIGAGQGSAAAALARSAFPGAGVALDKDLAGWDRYLSVIA